MQALPALADNELAPAIGLIFKLASETSFSSAEAVKTIRHRVKQRHPDALAGPLEAIRLAVNHHLDVAQEMLVDIDSECKHAKPLSEVSQHLNFIPSLIIDEDIQESRTSFAQSTLLSS